MKGKVWFLLCTLLVCISLNGLAQGKSAPKQKPAKPISDQTGAPADPPFMLKGFTPAFPDSMLVMVTSTNNQGYRGPKTYIENGQFLLTGEIPEPGIYNLLISNPKQKDQTRYFDLFLANEPSAIRFTGTAGNFEVLEGNSLRAFATLIRDFGADFETLSKLNQMRQTPGVNADSINTAWDTILQRVENNVEPFIKAYPTSPVAPFLLCTIWPVTSNKVDRVDGWLQQIDSSALQNDFGAAIKDYVATEKMFGYGQEAPNFVQNDVAGKPVELKSLRGKYVLVDFWASWCGPCRMENPNLVNAYQKFKGKNFTVLGVSLDRDKNKWTQAIAEDNLTWTHVSDLAYWNNAAAKLYKVQSIPQNFLLDPKGKIIGKNLRGPALDEFLAENLK
jgi:peroxiredoxin